MSGSPKRYQTDPYLPLPEAVVRQLRESGVPPPDVQQEMREAQDGPITMDACPHCQHCVVCAGTHFVTPAVAAEYRRLQIEKPEDPAR